MLAASVLKSFAGLTSTQALLFAAGLAGLTILIASTSRRVRKNRREERQTVQRQPQVTEQPASTVRDVEQVMTELDRLSREVHERLDAKIAKLERLIRDADGRIARLSSEVNGTSDGRLDVTLDEESPERDWSANAGSLERGSEPPSRTAAASQHAALYRLADEGLSTTEISKRTGRLAGEVELILSLRRVAKTV